MGTDGQQQDLQVERERVRVAAFAARLRRHGVLPLAIVAFNVGAYLMYLALAPRSATGDIPSVALLLAGAKENALVRSGEVWRLLASVFLHADVAHLAVNCVGAWVLAEIADNVFGSARTVVIYVVAGLAGAAASTLLSPEPSLGGSGAVFGLLGAVTAFAVRRARDIPRPLRKVLLAVLSMWLLASLSWGFGGDRVDLAAHAGGLSTGAVLALAAGRGVPLLQPHPRPAPAYVSALAAVAVGASMASMVASARNLLLAFELPVPALTRVTLPGVELPWPATWERGATGDGPGRPAQCVTGEEAFSMGLATGGPVCARDGYGTLLLAGRAGELVPGLVFDPAMTVEYGLLRTTDTRSGDVVRRAVMLNRDHALMLVAPAWIADKYDALLDAILRGVEFREGRDGATPGQSPGT